MFSCALGCAPRSGLSNFIERPTLLSRFRLGFLGGPQLCMNHFSLESSSPSSVSGHGNSGAPLRCSQWVANCVECSKTRKWTQGIFCANFGHCVSTREHAGAYGAEAVIIRMTSPSSLLPRATTSELQRETRIGWHQDGPGRNRNKTGSTRRGTEMT